MLCYIYILLYIYIYIYIYIYMYIRRRFVKSRNITEVIFKNVFSLIITYRHDVSVVTFYFLK